jgi:signal transduction histidine kinase
LLKAGLKARVLLSFAVLALTVLLAFAYGALTFRGLERRMQAVNDVHVPATRALNQIESSLFLLESDLDKSLGEGILRPKDALASVLESRLDLLERLNRADGSISPALNAGLPVLRAGYAALSDMLDKVYRNWDGRAVMAEELSQRRADFRLRLKTLIRDLDRESRDVSISVQAELRALALMLAALLGFSCLAAVVLSLWLAKSVRPLETLAQHMRAIALNGLSERSVQELAALPASHDEIGTLSRESFKMAASILDNHKALHQQKINLERAHQELAAQNDELRSTQNKLVHSEKLGLVGRMAAQMAHEIRNPLNALSLHTEILEGQLRGDAAALEDLRPLRTEINKLIAVTESYLDLARGPRLQKAPVEINQMVEELHGLYQPLLKEKGIFFTCDLGEIPAIPADRPQIAQVVANLIKNASEAFTDERAPGKRYIRVITAFRAHERDVTITVMDNGAGIAPELQKNIFSPFYTNKAEGTGLGLTFSRQVVEAHGGEIHFDSAVCQGTKFTVRLPVNEYRPTWPAIGKEASSWTHTGLLS